MIGTRPSTPTLQELKRARAVRRAFIALLALVVALGATGILGSRTGTARDQVRGLTLEVEYPQVTRPGLAAKVEIRVVAESRFSVPVAVAVTSDWMAIFDENGLDPAPSKSTSDSTWLTWTFDRPPANELVISFDARTEPGVQWGTEGSVKVGGSAESGPQVNFRTWVMP